MHILYTNRNLLIHYIRQQFLPSALFIFSVEFIMKETFLKVWESVGMVQIPIVRLGYGATSASVGKFFFVVDIFINPDEDEVSATFLLSASIKETFGRYNRPGVTEQPIRVHFYDLI